MRETERNFYTDLQLLMTETTNDASLLKTLVCLERQQHELIPEEYLSYRKIVEQIRSLIHGGQNCGPEKSTHHGHQPATQRTSGHQQDDPSSPTLLVATDNRSHPENVRLMHPVQNVR